MLPLQGASHLLNHDDLQAKELFLGMVKQGEENCLSDNRWSAVQCQGARRDPSLVLPAKKAASAAPAQEKPISTVATAIKDAAAGILAFIHVVLLQPRVMLFVLSNHLCLLPLYTLVLLILTERLLAARCKAAH